MRHDCCDDERPGSATLRPRTVICESLSQLQLSVKYRVSNRPDSTVIKACHGVQLKLERHRLSCCSEWLQRS